MGWRIGERPQGISLGEGSEATPRGDADGPRQASDGVNGMGPSRAPKPAQVEASCGVRAWWEGVDVKDLDNIDKLRAKPATDTPPPAARKAPASVAPAKGGGAAEAKAVAAPAEAMPAANRVEMLQMLWGEGFTLPGGEEFTMKLLQGIDLQEEHPCLDITAGLGGGARAIARQRNITVEGIESDAALAAAGEALSERDGMGKTAPIRASDLMDAELAGKRYGAIFARETLFALDDRKKLFSRLASSLRPQGSIVLTDFMLSDRKPGTEAMQAWRAAEPVKPQPYTVDEYAEILDQLRFNVRACDDLSTEYGAFIQAGWKRLHTCLQNAKLPPETATTLMNEGNLWSARSRALDSGQLRLISIKAALRPTKGQ